MPKKRRSGGHQGSNKGQDKNIQCTNCGRYVPRSKAKIVTQRINLVDAKIFGELKKTGAIIQSAQRKSYLCISCAIHRGVVSQRPRDERKNR